jgi:voltage-gated potassium channel
MTAIPHRDLTRSARRRLIATAAARSLGTGVALLGVYALMPVESPSTVGTAVRLIAGIAIVGALILWQVLSILRADYPNLRAVEAVLAATPTFLVIFALLYLGLAHTDASNFSQHLDKVSGMYFTVTVLTTVGFGDITARTDLARVIVTIQMLLDLLLVAVVVRVFFGAARTGLTRREDTAPPPV